MIAQFWSKSVAATGVDGPYEAWSFGEPTKMPELSTELALLVRDGPKRATASRLADYETESAPLPQTGDLSLILDGSGVPICVVRTTEVSIKQFGDVDAAFAWDEGEGDRSLDSWRNAHIWFFAQGGIDIDETTAMVLERFELLYPLPR